MDRLDGFCALLCPLEHLKRTFPSILQDAGRLLYIGQNEWTHVNCALWSAEVFEDDDGSLKNVHMAVIRGKQLVGTSKEHFVKLHADLESQDGSPAKRCLVCICSSLSFPCSFCLTLYIIELTEGIWKVILSLLSSEILWRPSEACKCEDWI